MATQNYELNYRSGTSDPVSNDISSISNFNHQVSPRVEPQSTMTINSYGNLKFIRKIKQYPVRFAVLVLMIVIVLSISITCIAVVRQESTLCRNNYS